MVAEQNKQLSRTKRRSDSQGNSNGTNNTVKHKKPKSKAKWFLYTGIAFVAFIIGSMLGYGILGKRNPLEVLNLDTWLHMYRLIFG